MSVSIESESISPERDESTVLTFPGQKANEYWATVVERVSHKDPETTDTGATIYSELVTFNDSLERTTVRELTIAEPNSNLVTVSPYAWVETDPWTTGERGLNRDKIKAYADLGFTVLWLHHGGRHSPIAKDKSISRSAHQMHAMLEDVKDTVNVSVKEVMAGGYSRGDMAAQKFIAMAAEYDRSVAYSDTEAGCFVKDMTRREKINALVHQAPGEAVGVGKLAVKLVGRAIEEKDPGLLLEYTKTPDLHMRNIINELMWAKGLINSSVGHAIANLPEDIVGVRTFYTGDIMSQQLHHEGLYAPYPGIAVVTEEGPHVAGAYPENLKKKYARMKKVMEYIHENDSLLGIQPEHVLPTGTEVSPGRRHLRSIKAS